MVVFLLSCHVFSLLCSYVVGTGAQDKSGAKRVRIFYVIGCLWWFVLFSRVACFMRSGYGTFRLICLEVRNQIKWMSLYSLKSWKQWKMFCLRSMDFIFSNFLELVSWVRFEAVILTSTGYRYEEAREEEKLRSQREDFSDMVAEVCYIFTLQFVY